MIRGRCSQGGDRERVQPNVLEIDVLQLYFVDFSFYLEGYN